MNERMNDYRIPADRHVGGSPETRAQRNLAAIRVLRQCEREQREPLHAERDILAGYVGWGAVPQLFAGLKPEWLVLQDELRRLLGSEEYEHARRSTTNAHYTGDAIVDAIWDAMTHLGMTSGMTWLEPALGVGNFFGRQPAELLGGRRFGVEKDSVTGKIAKLLYPEATILVKPFEETQFPKGYFDAAISNVPFGDFGVFDAEYSSRPWLTKSIHNYFFVKALDLVRPGGVVAFITSRYTMDAYGGESNGIRAYLASQAELLGAVRLPAGAFRDSAGTEVVADILFLRKHLPGETTDNPDWLKCEWMPLCSQGAYVNSYFRRHPECVLGQPTLARAMYSRNDYTVQGDLDPVALRRVLRGMLPAGALQPVVAEEEKTAIAVMDAPAAGKVEGYFLDGGRLFRRLSATTAMPAMVDANTAARIKAQLELRDALVTLLDAEREDQPLETLDRLRAQLNHVYRLFVLRFGAVSKRVNQVAIAGDPDAPLLLSLERDFDPTTQQAVKSVIFTERVLEPVRPVEAVGSSQEALSVSLNETGGIAWARMTELTGKGESELKADLSGLVFEDPESGAWQTAEEYLSGPVRQKLREAQARATVDARFQDNVAALEKVQPEDIPPSQITALLGVTWVPNVVYGEFIRHILNADTAPTVHYINGEFSFQAPWSRSASKWATADVSAYALVKDSMNLRRIKVYVRDGEKVSVDPDATLAARDRQAKLNDYFNEWLLATDEQRTAAMTRLYNERVNDLRLRTYDGSHLTFPGMSRACLRKGELEPYQAATVWRQICQKNCYLAHAVGAGKTYELIAGAMELRRLGLIRRPMFVVPNATLGGWQMQFQALYPGARVIVFSEKDLEKDRRQQTMARIATTQWDAVVVPHSSFQLIPVGEAVFTRHHARLSKQLEEAILDAQGEGLDSRFIKRLEKQKEKLLTSLQKRYRTAKDKTVTWEQLAIDHLAVDEAHEYKRLGFSTKQPQVAGIDPEGNQKTFDLLMKVRYTQEHGGRVVFASGTPVTNTMGELYNIKQYLVPGELETRGLGRFDEWAAAFGQVVEVFEPKPEGGGYQVKGRFARFVNVPELAQLFRSFSDVLTPDMLDIPKPGLVGGERRAAVNELSPAQQAYMRDLQDRAFAVRKSPREALPDCMIAIYGDAQMMALDVRMVMPAAPDHPDSRVNQAVENILRLYRASMADRGTQLVFSDFGKPASSQRYGLQRFSVYDDLIAKLVTRGIPREEIAHIYEPRNRVERANLFRRVNAGEVRVLLGSTAKMGIGVNVQERVVALHHLTLPHRPSDLEQREGRALRQGNRNPAVEVLYYITKGSLDELKFANVARKARAFAQFMQGGSSLREMEDIDEMTPSLEAFQAAASGDPRVRRKLEVDNELMRLGVLHGEWRNERWKQQRDRNYVPVRIAKAEEEIARLEAIAAARDSVGRVWTVDSETFEGDKIHKEGALALSFLVRRSGQGLVFEPVGTAWGSPLEANGRNWVRLGQCAEWIDVAKMDGAGMIQSIEYFLRHAEMKMAKKRDEIASAEKDAAELDTALAQPWEHQARHDKLRTEQAELFKALGGGHGEAAACVSEDNATVVDETVEAAEVPDEDWRQLVEAETASAQQAAKPEPVIETVEEDEFIWT